MEIAHPFYSDKRKSGIPLIGSLTWGADFCQFYQTGQDMMEVLGPYFRAGLEDNELCIWITSDSMAFEYLENALPGLNTFTTKGQLEVVSEKQWQTKKCKTGGAVVSMLDKAISKGFDGLRLAFNLLPAKKGGKPASLDSVDDINQHNVIAIFSYPRDMFDAAGIMDTVKNHRFALVRGVDRWEVIEGSELHVVRDALKKSEETLLSLFSHMSEGFAYHRIVLDDNGKPCDYIFHEVNEAFEKLIGLKRENILGKRVTEVLPGIEKDATDWIGKYGNVALTREPIQFENYSEALDRWYSVSAFSPHKGYFAVTFSDITVQKTSEKQLRESEEKLRVTLTSIGDAVIATDATGRIAFMNPVAAFLAGWDAEEASGRMIEEVFTIINEKTRKPAEDIVRRVLRDGRVTALANHTALISRDGREIPIEDSAAPIKDKTGRMSGVVLVFHDVTDQRKAQEELHENEERLRNLNRTLRALSHAGKATIHAEDEPDLLNSACHVIVEDCGYPMVWIGFTEYDENKTVRPVAQAGFEEGYLKTINITWADADRGRGPTGTAIRTGKPDVCKNIMTDHRMAPWREQAIKRGYASSIALPLITGGQTLGALTIYSREPESFSTDEVQLLSELADDLAYGIIVLRLRSERLQMEEEIRRSRDELELRVHERTSELRASVAGLEKLNQELQEFVHVTSHDLQEPLRKIQTFCDLIMTRCASFLDSKGQEYLDRVISSAGRMRQLLNGLLQLSKVSGGLTSFKDVDMGKIAREAADLFDEDLKKWGAAVDIRDMPLIEADETQVLRLFQNLIGNSIKYRREENPCITISGRRNGRQCEISIKDNGIGFEQESAERIFKPFQRLVGHKEYEGTGMGLAICRKIVERHGGNIRAESWPGKGSTFIINLPVSQDKTGGVK